MNAFLLSLAWLLFVEKRFMRMPIASWTALLAMAAAVASQAAEQPEMKAIVLHAFGGPEVLKYEDAPRPEPKEDELLIRVMAAAVNPVDVAIREGRFGGGKLPLILGMDVFSREPPAGAGPALAGGSRLNDKRMLAGFRSRWTTPRSWA